jgi:hypothetical protein
MELVKVEVEEIKLDDEVADDDKFEAMDELEDATDEEGNESRLDVEEGNKLDVEESNELDVWDELNAVMDDDDDSNELNTLVEAEDEREDS